MKDIQQKIKNVQGVLIKKPARQNGPVRRPSRITVKSPLYLNFKITKSNLFHFEENINRITARNRLRDSSKAERKLTKLSTYK